MIRWIPKLSLQRRTSVQLWVKRREKLSSWTNSHYSWFLLSMLQLLQFLWQNMRNTKKKARTMAMRMKKTKTARRILLMNQLLLFCVPLVQVLAVAVLWQNVQYLYLYCYNVRCRGLFLILHIHLREYRYHLCPK